MKIKKITSFSNNRQIWRLLISDNNKLLVEERDVNKKEAFFNLVDIASGKVLWKDFQLEEKYWIGVEAIYKDVILFHKYGKPDMPQHKEIIVHNLADKKIIWKSDSHEFLFVYDNKIFCIKKGFEKHNYVALDYLTGSIVEEYEDDFVKVNELRHKANSLDNYAGYLYSEEASLVADLDEAGKNFIEETKSKFEVMGKTEILKYSSYILFNFYSKNKAGLLTNRFYIFDTVKNKEVLSEVLIESANAFVPDSFFVKDDYLFLLKEKKQCIDLSIQRLGAAMEFTNEDKLILLKAARDVIKANYYDVPEPAVDYEKNPSLKLKCGAFVTLIINDELRGCIGYIESNEALFNTVCMAANQAALHDPRFYPLSKKEYEQIAIEISILTPPEPLEKYEDIVIGKHGLIVEESGRRGLLLPQVATDYNMTREEFLTAICQKAGLDKDLWKKKQIKLLGFTAEVFNEETSGEKNGN